MQVLRTCIVVPTLWFKSVVVSMNQVCGALEESLICQTLINDTSHVLVPSQYIVKSKPNN